MKNFLTLILCSVLVGSCFAAITCGYVMIGTWLGYFHPNYVPELGETLTGFYVTLYMCSVAPFPLLVLLITISTAAVNLFDTN